MTRLGKRFPKRAAYWWTDEIAELRQVCSKCRRNYTRERRTGEAKEESDALKAAKKILKAKMELSKKLKWEELRNDLNKAPWVLGYKIVMRKFGAQKSAPNLPRSV